VDGVVPRGVDRALVTPDVGVDSDVVEDSSAVVDGALVVAVGTVVVVEPGPTAARCVVFE
jgi:hypothetical protein